MALNTNQLRLKTDLHELIDHGAHIGSYSPHEAQLRRVATGRLIEYSPDARTMADLEAAAAKPEAFGAHLSPASASSYRSRAKKALTDYRRWRGHEDEWAIAHKARAVPPETVQQVLPIAILENQQFTLTLSPRRVAHLAYPYDLTATEAEILATALEKVRDLLRAQAELLKGGEAQEQADHESGSRRLLPKKVEGHG